MHWPSCREPLHFCERAELQESRRSFWSIFSAEGLQKRSQVCRLAADICRCGRPSRRQVLFLQASDMNKPWPLYERSSAWQTELRVFFYITPFCMSCRRETHQKVEVTLSATNSGPGTGLWFACGPDSNWTKINVLFFSFLYSMIVPDTLLMIMYLQKSSRTFCTKNAAGRSYSQLYHCMSAVLHLYNLMCVYRLNWWNFQLWFQIVSQHLGPPQSVERLWKCCILSYCSWGQGVSTKYTRRRLSFSHEDECWWFA